MPQPLIKPCIVEITTGLTHRPDHAAALGEIVGISGRLESYFGWLLAFLTRGSAEITIAMFHATTSTDAQRAMLCAAAELSLSGTEKQVFDDIMSDFRARYGERSKLVHNLWCTSDSHPDKALLCKASDAGKYFAGMAAVTTLEQFADAQGAGIWEKCLSYTVKDLKDVAGRLREYTERVDDFLGLLIARHPVLASALSSDEQDGEQTQETPQEIPDQSQTAPK